MDIEHLDCFRFCKCLKLLGNVMVLLVLGLVGVSYFAVAFAYFGNVQGASSGTIAGSVFIVGLFTLLVLMVCWSYFATVFSNPGIVPAGWHPFGSDEEAARQRDALEAGQVPRLLDAHLRPRFCRKCQAWKPQRAHHCSVSNRCILKMDHYCIWVVNCVGLLNYKFFLLFLFWTCVASVVGCALLLPEFLLFFTSGAEAEEKFGSMVALVFVAFIIDLAFTVSLAAFVAMHWNMVSRNQTTIEMYEKAPLTPWPYDRGVMGNWKEVLGREPLLWLLPFHRNAFKEELLRAALDPYLAGTAAPLPTALSAGPQPQETARVPSTAEEDAETQHDDDPHNRLI
uniref:S-acyltransferase n=1 Tax=Tetraselmis chuii TaxID=63592 RepID=A0A7S1X6Y1_9CHLO|mmetsp:Transcript_37441/g.67056  ORF Transcript_37441/g.67056 Transcript_37441/m.67056 type:complete len:340 (+) Transcript_37441:124-1143(+)